MAIVLIGISVFIAALYVVLILVFAVAFILRPDDSPAEAKTQKFVSIIVAFRNEKANLSALIESLSTQKYSGDYEIILVDDHSEDSPEEILNKIKVDNLKVFSMPESMTGKKAALRYAVSQAKGEILVFTDADCVMGNNWLQVMSDKLCSEDFQMLCGPVEFLDKPSLLSELFQLEFLSLTGSGAAGFFINKPFMCNGANYAVTKVVFDEASVQFNDKYTSGDDVFLLHYISKKHKVGFIKNLDAIVRTQSPSSLIDFFNQRVRWASKTTGYKNPFSIYTAVLTFLMSALSLVLFVLTLFNIDYLSLFVIIICAKTIVDLIFLVPVTQFYRKSKLLLWLPLLQIFYPFYIFTTAFLAMFYKPYWKGRRI